MMMMMMMASCRCRLKDRLSRLSRF